MCDFCEKYANVSGKHGTIRLGTENYMLFANSENEPMGAIKIKNCPLCGRELTDDGTESGTAKAVLVMDMPRKCLTCSLLRIKNEQDSMICTAGRFRDVTDIINSDEKNKPDWCPLRELPKRETEMADADDLGRDYVRGTMDGWNACLEEIDPSENL